MFTRTTTSSSDKTAPDVFAGVSVPDDDHEPNNTRDQPAGPRPTGVRAQGVPAGRLVGWSLPVLGVVAGAAMWVVSPLLAAGVFGGGVLAGGAAYVAHKTRQRRGTGVRASSATRHAGGPFAGRRPTSRGNSSRGSSRGPLSSLLPGGSSRRRGSSSGTSTGGTSRGRGLLSRARRGSGSRGSSTSGAGRPSTGRSATGTSKPSTSTGRRSLKDRLLGRGRGRAGTATGRSPAGGSSTSRGNGRASSAGASTSGKGRGLWPFKRGRKSGTGSSSGSTGSTGKGKGSRGRGSSTGASPGSSSGGKKGRGLFKRSTSTSGSSTSGSSPTKRGNGRGRGKKRADDIARDGRSSHPRWKGFSGGKGNGSASDTRTGTGTVVKTTRGERLKNKHKAKGGDEFPAKPSRKKLQWVPLVDDAGFESGPRKKATAGRPLTGGTDDAGFPANVPTRPTAKPKKAAAPSPAPAPVAAPEPKEPEPPMDESGFPLTPIASVTPINTPRAGGGKPSGNERKMKVSAPTSDEVRSGYAQMIDQSTPESRARTLDEAANTARRDAQALQEMANDRRAEAAALDGKKGMQETAEQFRREASALEDDALNRLGMAGAYEKAAETAKATA